MFLRRHFRSVAGVIAAAVTVVALLPFAGSRDVLAAGNIHAYNTSTYSADKIRTVIEGTFDPVSVDQILNKINAYRYEACEQGIRDPRNPNRNLTLDDYVPIKWSYELEQMAMLRAAEGSIVMDHVRPDGTRCWSARYGVGSNNEVLAWYGGLLSGIGGWYEEKEDWINQTSGAVTGHYTAMIDPSNTYCGVSCFNGCAAGEFCGSRSDLNQSKIDVSQYSGQYTEVSASYISSISFIGDSVCQYNGGTGKFFGTFDFSAVDYWGRSFTISGMKYVGGGTWTSSNPSALTVAGDGTMTGGSMGLSTVTFTCGSLTYTKEVSVVNGAPMYRMYNEGNGEHLYTANAGERDYLVSVGWNYEGVGWIAPTTSDTPVYRLFNEGNGEHLYIADQGEISFLVEQRGWNNEGTAFYSNGTSGVPVYRLFNPNEVTNNHHFTTDVGERDWLDSIGWNYEGVALYGA